MTDPRARVLVEPENLDPGAPGLLLLDVRWNLGGPPGQPEYEAGHLPGALWVDLETELSGPPGAGGRHPLPDPAAFATALRRLGVHPQSDVVAYDGATSLATARLWWLLTDAGHEHVRVLDGGYAGWVEAGLPVETGPVPVPGGGTFLPQPGHRGVVGAADVLAGAEALTVVDVRAPERYRGEVEPVDPVAGHIPGAVNRPSAALLDQHSRFRPATQVLAAYADLDAPVLYCGSGITAAHSLLSLESAGRTDARIYPGSWSDWIRDPGRPVARGG